MGEKEKVEDKMKKKYNYMVKRKVVIKKKIIRVPKGFTLHNIRRGINNPDKVAVIEFKKVIKRTKK